MGNNVPDIRVGQVISYQVAGMPDERLGIVRDIKSPLIELEDGNVAHYGAFINPLPGDDERARPLLLRNAAAENRTNIRCGDEVWERRKVQRNKVITHKSTNYYTNDLTPGESVYICRSAADGALRVYDPLLGHFYYARALTPRGRKNVEKQQKEPATPSSFQDATALAEEARSLAQHIEQQAQAIEQGVNAKKELHDLVRAYQSIRNENE